MRIPAELIPGVSTLKAALYGGALVAALGAVTWFALHERGVQAAKDRPVIVQAQTRAAVGNATGDLAKVTLNDSAERQANELNIHVVADQGRASIMAAPEATTPLAPGVDAAWRGSIAGLRAQAAPGADGVGSLRGGSGAAATAGPPSPPR